MTSQRQHVAVPRRAHYGALLVAFLGFAIYGSLVPLKFAPLDFSAAVERFADISWMELGTAHRADWVANILLFVPLGYLGLATFEVDRPVGLRTWIVALVCLTVWTGTSLALEFTQLWFPPRTVSVNDIVAESLGAIVGMVGWFAAGQRSTDWIRRLVGTRVGEGVAVVMLPGYLFLLVLIHVMPLDLTISPAELYRKYTAGRLTLIPFMPPHGSLSEMGLKYLQNAVYFTPVGWLLAHLPRQRWNLRGSWGVVLAVGVAISGTIEALQLLVWSRYTDISDILLGTLEIVAGYWLAQRFSPNLHNVAVNVDAAPSGAALAARSLGWFSASLIWAGVIAAVSWYPFDFHVEPREVAKRLENFSLIPFFDYYRQSEFKSFDNVLRRTLWYLPLGAALGMFGRSLGRNIPAWVFLPVAALVASGVEAAQFLLPKFPSVTDALLGTFGAGLGLLLVGYLARRVPLHAGNSN